MTGPTSSRAENIANHIDHTLLRVDTTEADIVATVDEAIALGAYSICVSPNMLPIALPADADLKVTAVVGFPSGKHLPEIKAAEAAAAVRAGADEIDMVADIGAIRAGDEAMLRADIAAVRSAVPPPTVLKVIIESAALTDEQIVLACEAAVEAGADYVKTSTGFHPAGGATVAAVRLMARTVAGKVKVKASGGIRSYSEATAMLAAGADRLGVSATRHILDQSSSPAGAQSGY